MALIFILLPIVLFIIHLRWVRNEYENNGHFELMRDRVLYSCIIFLLLTAFIAIIICSSSPGLYMLPQ